MDRTMVALVLWLCVAGVAVSSPIITQDLDNEVTDTTSAQPASAREEPAKNLVIVAREEEEEELLPSQSSGPVFYREEQELVATPVLVAPRLIVEDDLDVLGGELMETANSGLVFRPQFRYRKQSRRRYNRNTRRRYGSPFYFGF